MDVDRLFLRNTGAGMVFPVVFAQVKKRELSMKLTDYRKGIVGLLVFSAALLDPRISSACPICFGDPNSALTLGAKAGVFFLLGVVVVVLGAIVGVGIFWARRARLMEVQDILHGEANRPN
jgi:hypothetical protein